MKKIAMLCVLSLLTLMSMAQLAPPTSEDDLVRVSYKGYSNGHFMVEIYNKQGCAINHYVEWGNNYNRDSLIQVSAGSNLIVNLPFAFVPHAMIRVRPDSRCNSSFGTYWREICAPSALPLKFIRFSARKAN